MVTVEFPADVPVESPVEIPVGGPLDCPLLVRHEHELSVSVQKIVSAYGLQFTDCAEGTGLESCVSVQRILPPSPCTPSPCVGSGFWVIGFWVLGYIAPL